MIPKLFSELGLSEDILKAIDKLGFEQAAPIQAEAIPVLMSGKDVVGQSQTGSGKTAAFGVPAIEKVEVSKRATQILVLCPTRELAVQVSEEIHKLALFKKGLHALPVYGGQSYDRQLLGLRQGAHIVIGTPGRVMDHMRRGTLKLDALKMVILDEVDVMLNMGFRDDIELILQATPKERQTVFFSATIPRPIQQLIEKYSRDAQQIRIEQKALTVPTVDQVYYECDRRYKVELLTRLIDINDLKLGIIFCNTKRMVDELVDHLNAQGYSADRLHGDMSQMMRDRVMNKFRKSGLEFLVATDVAARGIDVDDVQVVFNYDLPYDVEDYVHRIGRTGRAGRSGLAVSFVAGREMFQIYNIERFIKMKIKRGRAPSANEVDEARANVFLDKIRLTLQSPDFKRQDHLIERLLEEGYSSTDIASALLHHMQHGEGTPAKAPVREEREERPRPERAPREERPARPVVVRAPLDQDRPKKVVTPPKPARMKTVNMPVPVLVPAPVVEAAPAVEPEAVVAVVPVKTPETVVAEVKPVEPKAPVAKAPEAKPVTPVATFSDEEILASVAPKKVTAKPGTIEKPSRRTPDNQTRLFMNVGEEMEVKPIDIVNLIAGETGLPGKVVGKVDIRERHLFVDVASEHVKSIIAKLNRSELKTHKLKVKIA